VSDDILQQALIREASNVAACKWLGQGGSPSEYVDYRHAFQAGAMWAMGQFREIIEQAQKELEK
jgi:hypothetical protein